MWRSGGQSVLLDAEESRAIDRAAIEQHGIAAATLMAAAAAGAARVARGRFPRAQRVLVVGGGGQNGGDGFEVARLLRLAGRDVRVVRVASRPSTGAAAEMLQAALLAGVPVRESPTGSIEDDLLSVDLVVDALLGTGATGAPRGGVAAAISAITASGLPVLALDIPSGVDASTGEVPGVVIQAVVTATFHAEKVGLRVMPGLLRAGTVVTVPIGAPTGPPGRITLVQQGSVRRRGRAGSKYDAGVVVVIGGATGMTGAPALAASAALRAGAGVVIALVPPAIVSTVAMRRSEVMVRPIVDASEVPLLAERADAIVIGPGLGREPAAADIVRQALAVDVPVVVDADALWWLAQDPSLLGRRRAVTVLTPHAGEAARLLQVDSGEIAAHRLASVRDIAERTGAICVLKGSDTLLAASDGRCAIRAGDNAGLATAGAGDVLSGIIGAFIARNDDPWQAVQAATLAHLAAADAAAARRSGAIMAGDLIEHLPVFE